MTLLVVGVSHRTAPVTVLDRVALVDGAAERLQVELLASAHVAESLVLSTCNRVEIYAEVSKFHGGVLDVTETLAKATGVDREELTPHLYVRYEDRAVQHLFEVAAGLDSMVVGEQQILGQVRGALRTGQDLETIGRNLNDLAQAALRVGKRVHHDTGIDRAGASVVSVALHLAADSLGGSLAGKRALVVGAGAMSGLAAATLVRAGIGEIVVANRTFERGQHLAEQVGGRAVRFDDVAATVADVDVVFSCTGSTGRSSSRPPTSRPRAAGSTRRSRWSTSRSRTTPRSRSRPSPASRGSTSRRSSTSPRRTRPSATSSSPARSWWRRCARTSPPSPRSGSSPSSSACAATPTRSSRPSSTGCASSCPVSARPSSTRSRAPCGARCRRCCTGRPCA